MSLILAAPKGGSGRGGSRPNAGRPAKDAPPSPERDDLRIPVERLTAYKVRYVAQLMGVHPAALVTELLAPLLEDLERKSKSNPGKKEGGLR